MKNYKEMEKELVDYVKNTSSDSIDLERFLRFQNYGLILDFDSLSNDFFRWNPRMITNTIFAMLAIKSKFEMDRPRKKEDGSLYKYFKKQYGQLISENRIYDFSREDFEHFYHCFCGYTLTPLREENIKNSVHVFSKFLTDHFNQKEIYDILSKLNDDPEQFLNHTIHDVFDEQLVQDFQNQLRKAIRGSEFSTVLIQTLSSIYMKNQKESLIENHILYYLFTSNLNCFNDAAVLTHTVRKAFIKANINIRNKKAGAHSLRHSLATNLLKNNTPLPVIKGILGHTNISTTEKYLSIDIEGLRMVSLEVPL